jgi:hypothetical protein
MSTFALNSEEYSFTVRRRNALHGKDQECFIVDIIRSSDKKEWTGASHFVAGLTDEYAESKIGERLRDAFQHWKVDSIAVVFDIPQDIPQNEPAMHKCFFITSVRQIYYYPN